MKNFLNSIGLITGQMPDRIRPYRWYVAISTLLLTIFMMVGASKVTIDMTIDSWFAEDDSALLALDKFRSQFGSDDGLFIVYKPKDGNVFSDKSLRLMSELEAELLNWRVQNPELKQLEHITRIRSLTSVNIQKSYGDNLISERLVPSDGTGDLEAIRNTAYTQEEFQKLYFSDDGRYGGFTIDTDFGAIPVQKKQSTDADLNPDNLDLTSISFEFSPTAEPLNVEFQDTDMMGYTDFMVDLHKIIDQPKYQEHFEFFPTGVPAMMHLAADSMNQVGMLFMCTILIITVMLWLLLRSPSAVVWPITAIAVSVIWVVGFCGWMNIVLSQILGLTVMLVLAIGIADCVHVMSAYLYHCRQGKTHEVAITMAYEKTGLPIFLATITTMVGMLALSTNSLIQFKLFGLTAAAGVLLAFIFTIVVLPALLEFWHPKIKPLAEGKPQKGLASLLSFTWLQTMFNKIPDFVARYPRVIIAVFVGLGGLFIYGTLNGKINTNFVDLYKEGTPFRTAYQTVDEHMAGTGNLQIMLNTGQSDALFDPEVLMTLDRVQNHLEEHYSTHVIRTYSLADIVKDTHKVMTDNTQKSYVIPDDPRTVSQLLYLFNSSNPKDRQRLVSDDYSQTHISVQLRNAGSYEYEQYFTGLQSQLAKEFEPLTKKYPELSIEVTGTLAIMMKLSSYLAQQQFDSLLLATMVIALILFLTLGSIQGGLIGFLPNILPAMFTFGILGLFGIPLDSDTFMIAPLIIGIAVDDTIHFVTHYRLALDRHHDMNKALRETIKEVGQAVTFTTLVLGLGFFALSFSDYLGFAKIGMIGSAALFLALLCDLLLLPALIMVFKPTFGKKPADTVYKQQFISS